MTHTLRASISATCLVPATTAPPFAGAEEREHPGALAAIPDSLRCETPVDGYALAIRLSRLAPKAAQPAVEALKATRNHEAGTADGLLGAAEALDFRTIAEAKDYWRRGWSCAVAREAVDDPLRSGTSVAPGGPGGFVAAEAGSPRAVSIHP